MMETVKQYVGKEAGFAAFVITVILCTILAALALLSVAGSYMGLATGWIPPEVRQLELYAALLLTIFFLAGEFIRDIN